MKVTEFGETHEYVHCVIVFSEQVIDYVYCVCVLRAGIQKARKIIEEKNNDG